jgi:hypothetical protein
MLNLRFHATAKQYDVIGVSERAKECPRMTLGYQ